MTYRGHIKDGVVVLDGNPPLAEGTLVRVEPVEQPRPDHPRGSAQAVLQSAGGWADDPDIARSLAELREEKQLEMWAKREALRRSARK